jgi:hypothetical protein
MDSTPYQSGAIAKLRERLVELDGFMSANNVGTIVEDVGDVPVDPIPKAGDLADSDMDCDNGYCAGTYCTMETNGGAAKMFDSCIDVLSGDRVIIAEKGSYINNIEEWR